MALATLRQLKDELRITHALEDDLITRKLAEAQAIVLDYLKTPGVIDGSPAEWDEDSVPLGVRAAILKVGVKLYRRRGDDDDDNRGGEADGYLTPDVTRLLHRYRDPAIA